MLLILFFLLILSVDSNKTLYEAYSSYNGYSSQTKSIGTGECYLPRKLLISELLEVDNFSDSYLSHEQLLLALKISNISNAHYFLKANDLYSHIRQNSDSELSLSISYYKAKYNEYTNEYNFKSDSDLFQEYGLQLYQSRNEKFIIECGDYVVESFQKGISLLVTLKIFFHTKGDKILFVTKPEGEEENDYGGIENVLKVIEAKANKLNMQGDIEISYIQLGGNDTEIQELKNESGNRCSFSKISTCAQLLGQLGKYAKEELFQQFDKYPLNREILSLGNLVKIRFDSGHEIDIPQPKISESMITKQNYIFDLVNKLEYYQRNLNAFTHYPVYTGELIKYLKELETIHNNLLSSNVIECFTKIDEEVCNEIYNTFSQKLNQTKIEENINKELEIMKMYSVYIITLKDDMCLKGKMRWDDVHNLNIYMFPNGSGKEVVLENNEFQYKNAKVESDDDFSLDIIDGAFVFNFAVHNKKNKNMASVSCVEKNWEISKSFNVMKEEKSNPFYFDKYVSSMDPKPEEKETTNEEDKQKII